MPSWNGGAIQCSNNKLRNVARYGRRAFAETEKDIQDIEERSCGQRTPSWNTIESLRGSGQVVVSDVLQE